MFQKNNPPSESSVRRGVIVVLAILAVALGMRVYAWLFPPEAITLLSKDPGLVSFNTIEELTTATTTPVLIPTQTFEATLAEMGVYGTEAEAFPADMVALVYVREGARFVEINVRPKQTWEKERLQFIDLPQETIQLTQDVSAHLITLRDSFVCDLAKQAPAHFCQFTRLIIFAYEEALVYVFADGNQATTGELIELARSMISE